MPVLMYLLSLGARGSVKYYLIAIILLERVALGLPDTWACAYWLEKLSQIEEAEILRLEGFKDVKDKDGICAAIDFDIALGACIRAVMRTIEMENVKK